ncbi:hypothetical protein HEK616_81240 (plasmid) [Streptomyces nigrescens]|uniref:Lipoprotein n=2 Tax=Streptomyces TaxID=1883 RepID=A0ABM8A7K1_STRNI|nr:hypothetical protein [Streptomyces nigrescens]MEE4420645.1 hypothetical protein [Streptomyces sp. DSM 41528]BDM74637.1 hypothetical protein HEK616_81240 [Streptomyces nigrescens]
MRRTLLPAVPVLLLVLAGCGSRSDAVTVDPAHPDSTTTSPSLREQDRSLPCGRTVDRPVVVSGPDEPLQLTVTSLRRQGSGLRTAYRITSGDRKEMLSLPIGEVPPTARLLKHGVVVGRQKPAADKGPDGSPAIGYPVGRRPYTGTLAIDSLCDGTTWSDVDRHPGDYQVAVVMSVQPHGEPSDSRPAGGVLPLPLLEATRDLSAKGR